MTLNSNLLAFSTSLINFGICLFGSMLSGIVGLQEFDFNFFLELRLVSFMTFWTVLIFYFGAVSYFIINRLIFQMTFAFLRSLSSHF